MFAQIVQKLKKAVSFDKTANVYHYAELNYPEITDYLYKNSISAQLGVDMFFNFIIGKGYIQNKTKVGKQTLYSFLRKVGKSIAKNKGVFIHVNFSFADGIKISSFDVIPFSQCRIGKKDDKSYNGKISVSKDWTKKEHTTFDVFNFNESVIKSQVKKSGGIENYKGQILYITLEDEDFYPMSTIHPVMNDCYSEINASVYKSNALARGFFGRKMFITPPFVSAEDRGEILYSNQNKRRQFDETLESFMGAENVGGIMRIEAESIQQIDEVEKYFKMIDIKDDLNDKQWEYTEKSVGQNIIKAFKNIPPLLVFQNDGVFGNSGESIKQAQIQYQTQTTFERDFVNELINDLWKKSTFYDGTDLQIIHLIDITNETVNN
jgi:hypothetical protein